MNASDAPLRATPRVGLILLAAGESSRMGQPKQLLPYRGVTLLRHAAQEAVASGCRPIVVVLGSQAQRMQSELAGMPLETAVNDRWQSGMGSSLKLGLSKLLAIDGEIAGVTIMVCDQPFVDRHLLGKLLQAHAAGSERVACEYGATFGVPALFGRSWFAALAALEDGHGAKKLLAPDNSEIAQVPFPQGAIDLDTATDYERLAAAAREAQP